MEVKDKIQAIVSVFETGSAKPRYHKLVVMADGKGGTFQITYGKHQTTEQSHLAELVSLYMQLTDEPHRKAILPYMAKLGKTPLYNNGEFKRLLIDAGLNDPNMKVAQDRFFDEAYWMPAERFYVANGFRLNLSMLVIYDSFIHSGGVPAFLRKRFAERVPVNGGSEKIWIKDYVATRHQWLQTHSNSLLQRCIYRTQCFKTQMGMENWDLAMPVNANGIVVT